MRFGDEAGRDIAGNQWAWERDDSAAAVRDTMGWDCIFLANLIVAEFKTDLDDYLSHVFPQLVSDCKDAVSKAQTALATSVSAVDAEATQLQDFVDQSAAIIAYKDVTFDQLSSLNSQILQKYHASCPLQLRELYETRQAANEAYTNLLRLRDELRTKFQDAARISDFSAVWDPHFAPFADMEALLRRAGVYLDGQTPCSKLIVLLAAIPLRVEQARISGINQSLQAVSDQILADLTAVARDREIEKVKTELTARALHFASLLENQRSRRRFENASTLADQIEERFHAYCELVKTTVSLLSSDAFDAKGEEKQLRSFQQRRHHGSGR